MKNIGGIWQKYWNICIKIPLHACVLGYVSMGERTSYNMKNELYQTNVKSIGFIYIETRSSTICIDLSIHVQ